MVAIDNEAHHDTRSLMKKERTMSTSLPSQASGDERDTPVSRRRSLASVAGLTGSMLAMQEIQV
jgi:hypothetical protein